MYPEHACKGCGKPLNEKGHRPAELHAGCYTGLCYTCERGPAQPVRQEPDGAAWWSHPPHCPSWRRDREVFVGYTGCSDCGGKGRKMVSRPDSQGGSYPMSCKTCRERYSSHPSRQQFDSRVERLRHAAHNVYQARFSDSMTDEQYDALRAPILEKYQKGVVLAQGHRDRGFQEGA